MKIHPLLVTLFLAGVSRTYGVFKCSGTITVASTAGGVLDDDVRVVGGADCKIEAGVTINGNIKVKRGASLEIEATDLGCVSVNGDIKCNRCEGLKIVGSDQCPTTGLPVSGSIGASRCLGDVVIAGANVAGGINIRGCDVDELRVTDNVVPEGKRIFISDNDAATVEISSNKGTNRINFDEDNFNGLTCTAQPPPTLTNTTIPDITIAIQSQNMASGGFVLPSNQYALVKDDEENTVYGPEFKCETEGPYAATLTGGECYSLVYVIFQANSEYEITVSVDSGSSQVLTPFNVDVANDIEEYSVEFGVCDS